MSPTSPPMREKIGERRVKRFVHEVHFPISKPRAASKVLESETPVQDISNSEKCSKKKRPFSVTESQQQNPVNGKYRGVRQRKWGNGLMRYGIRFSTSGSGWELKRLEFKDLSNSVEFSSEKTSINENGKSVSSAVSSGDAESMSSYVVDEKPCLEEREKWVMN